MGGPALTDPSLPLSYVASAGEAGGCGYWPVTSQSRRRVKRRRRQPAGLRPRIAVTLALLLAGSGPARGGREVAGAPVRD